MFLSSTFFGIILFCRFGEFETALMEIDNALKLRNLSKTRWLARSEAIRAVWAGIESIQDTLKSMIASENFDKKTSTQAVALVNNLQSVDFVICIMFMKNIMHRVHQMTLALQSEELNIIDAVTIIESTVELIKRIRENEDEMNGEIDAAIVFLKKLGVEDPHEEFSRKHRVRRMPSRFDENNDNTEVTDMKQFYRCQFNSFLDILIVEYGDNLARAFETLKPLYVVLKPPLSVPTIAEMEAIIEFFPRPNTMDTYALHTEFSNFVVHSQLREQGFQTLQEIASFAEERNSAFPLTSKTYQLLMTIPVSVAEDERTFSRLKIIKNPLRTTMSDRRLESLLLLSCEKDLTDSLNLTVLVKNWAALKLRRLSSQQ